MASGSTSSNVVGVHYRVGKKIGEGSFGVIFEGTNLLNQQQVAIKFEPRKSDAPQLRDEYRTYKILVGCRESLLSFPLYRLLCPTSPATARVSAGTPDTPIPDRACQCLVAQCMDNALSMPANFHHQCCCIHLINYNVCCLRPLLASASVLRTSRTTHIHTHIHIYILQEQD